MSGRKGQDAKDIYQNGIQSLNPVTGEMVNNDDVIVNLADTIDTATDAVRVVSAGEAPASNLAANESVFGDTIVATRTAQTVGNFYLGIQEGSAILEVVGSGTLSITGNPGFENLLTIATGTTVGSSVDVADRDPIRYVPGFEMGAWFTAIWDAPTVDGKAKVGFMDESNGFWIGYEGNVFGVCIRKDNVETFIPQSNFSLDTLDGNGPSGFNLDTTKGNIFRIRAGYLGFAPPTFEIVLPNGKLIPFHVQEYPNSADVTHISSTYISPRVEVSNGSVAEDVSVKIGSYCAYVVAGDNAQVNDRDFAVGLTGTVPSGIKIEETIIAFRNTGDFQGFLSPTSKKHEIPSVLTSLYLGLEGQTSNVLFERYIVPESALLNAPTWEKADDDSILDYTTDSPLYDLTQGRVTLPRIIPGSGGFFGNDFGETDTQGSDTKLRPGEHVVYVVTGGGTAEFEYTLGVSWSEKF